MNLPEPVTLDFLDAEVEDSSKEEVSMNRLRTDTILFSGSFLLSLLNSRSTLLLGQCTAAAPEGHSGSTFILPSESPRDIFFPSNIIWLKKNTLCFLDQATNDWWPTGWNADQNSPQVHRWGKFVKWFHLNETLKSTFVDPERCSQSQK